MSKSFELLTKLSSLSIPKPIRQSRRRLLIALGAGAGLFILLHFISLSGSPVGSLPGFAARSSTSRRTDAHQISARRHRLLQGSSSSLGGIGPANFSDLAPFTFCPTFGEGDELGQVYGPEAILKTRTHVGSSERIRRVMRRAMSGLPITIGVLGGSVSSCHGLDATTAHPLGNPIGPNCYPHRIFSWLNDVFPHPANELTNGACKSIPRNMDFTHLPLKIPAYLSFLLLARSAPHGYILLWVLLGNASTGPRRSCHCRV